MILMDETIFDDFAIMSNYNLETFLEKVQNYAYNGLGITEDSNHPFWDNLRTWLDENQDLFDDLWEIAA